MYDIHKLIEKVKYGDAAPAYHGDLRADLVDALRDLETAQARHAELLEGYPEPSTFEAIGAYLVAIPDAFETFRRIIGEVTDFKQQQEGEA